MERETESERQRGRAGSLRDERTNVRHPACAEKERQTTREGRKEEKKQGRKEGRKGERERVLTYLLTHGTDAMH